MKELHTQDLRIDTLLDLAKQIARELHHRGVKHPGDDRPCDYSLFIKHPSPDLQNDEEYMKGREVLNSTMALKDLTQLRVMGFVNGEPILPESVISFLRQAIREDHYRVELIIGTTEYKLYKKYNEGTTNGN